MKKLCGLALVLASLPWLSGIAVGSPPEPKDFVAVLSGECAAAENSWHGLAVFHLNEDGSIDYKVVVNNVGEDLLAGHIHLGATGAIVQDVAAAGSGNGVLVSGTFTNPTLVSGLVAGTPYYVNLHTATCFLPGAVRGDIRAATPG